MIKLLNNNQKDYVHTEDNNYIITKDLFSIEVLFALKEFFNGVVEKRGDLINIKLYNGQSFDISVK